MVHIGDDVSVQVLEIQGGKVQLGFTAPPEILILRNEVRQRLAAGESLHQIRDILDQRENQER